MMGVWIGGYISPYTEFASRRSRAHWCTLRTAIGLETDLGYAKFQIQILCCGSSDQWRWMQKMR